MVSGLSASAMAAGSTLGYNNFYGLQTAVDATALPGVNLDHNFWNGAAPSVSGATFADPQAAKVPATGPRE